jgi:hypothetical protein
MHTHVFVFLTASATACGGMVAVDPGDAGLSQSDARTRADASAADVAELHVPDGAIGSPDATPPPVNEAGCPPAYGEGQGDACPAQSTSASA